MQPRQATLTLTPVRPKFRYSMRRQVSARNSLMPNSAHSPFGGRFHEMARAVTQTEGPHRGSVFSAEHERRRRGPPRQPSSQPRRGARFPSPGRSTAGAQAPGDGGAAMRGQRLPQMARAGTQTEDPHRGSVFSAEHEHRRRGPPRQASSQPRRGARFPSPGLAHLRGSAPGDGGAATCGQRLPQPTNGGCAPHTKL